ncbi:MAG TPA: type I-D CRISPR-associated protein Cas5/Csc1 [Anaerolineae bacterium]|nr:type I-D CRISPR-associated protein Cas5/Csc1 [Anaerolineae bacterium]HPL28804.1 type I-D CRISPR-associated protein Cas5/Csc1 [Anaerolineae bacterium]
MLPTTRHRALPAVLYGALELHGDLFFASLEFHDLVETLPVIHNYALTYALDLCVPETGRVTPLYWAMERRKQQPRYLDDFANLVQAGTYVTPAKSVDAFPPTAIRQYATRVDEYLHWERKIDDVLSWEPNPKKRKANTLASVFPLHGYLKVIMVGARFLFYVYNPPAELQMERYIRLGKFNTKAAVVLAPCSEVAVAEAGQVATHPVNPADVPGALPLNLLTMRPTPLAMAARLSHEALLVTHPDPWSRGGRCITAHLPISPHYGGATTGGADAVYPHRGGQASSGRPRRR